LSCLPVWLPSPPEQQAIVAFLDRETAKIDGLVKKKERLIELLQEKRAAIISQAVTKGLPSTDSGQATLEYRTALISAAVTGKIDVREEVEKGSSTQ